MMRTRVSLFASFVLISAVPLAGLALAQKPHPAYPPQQTTAQQSQDNPADVRTFAGKISKSGGKYVLQDASSKTAFSLDDQQAAKKYEGKSVVVTGSLDTLNNIIHVQKIEEAA
jgi:Protein of unknown function (DUF5818)